MNQFELDETLDQKRIEEPVSVLQFVVLGCGVRIPNKQGLWQRQVENVVDAATDSLPSGLFKFWPVADDQILQTIDTGTCQLLVLLRHTPEQTSGQHCNLMHKSVIYVQVTKEAER